MNLGQLEYKANGTGESQCERILDALRFWPAGEWCPMPHLARCASRTGDGAGLAVHSRIADLRRALKPQGWTIEKRILYSDGRAFSSYRLIRITGVVSASAEGNAQYPKKPAGSALSEATAPASPLSTALVSSGDLSSPTSLAGAVDSNSKS